MEAVTIISYTSVKEWLKVYNQALLEKAGT